MADSCDALVIGGGPAGATAALLLARAGWSVVVLEKKRFPRRKVCGEYLSATNLPLLEHLGLADDFRASAGPPVCRVGLFAGSATLSAGLPRLAGRHGWGQALSRERLDTLLLGRAAQAGADVRQPWTAVALRRDGAGYRCRAEALGGGTTEEVQARVVIAAHGSWDAGSLPTQPRRRPPRSADLFGFKAHFRNSTLPAGFMPLLAFPGGYGGMVHCDGGRISLSCCIRRDRLTALRGGAESEAGETVLQHLLDSCAGVRRALAGARRCGAWLATGPIRPGIRVRDCGGVFPVGNAAGEAHPVVAEGISMALQGSWLLTTHLRRWQAEGGRPQALGRIGTAYARAWRRSFAPRLRASSALAHWAMRPRAVACALPLLRCFPALLSWAARLSGKTTRVIPTGPYFC